MPTAKVPRLVCVVVSIGITAAACGSETDSAVSTADAVQPSAPTATATVPATIAPTIIVSTIGADPMTSDPSTDPPSSDPTEPAATGDPQSTMDRLAAIAIADAAGRFDVDAATIAVVSATAVTWRDGAVGCPSKGMQYTQVLTPGSRIVLDVDGTNRQYHTGGRRTDPFYCAEPETPSNTDG